MQMKNIKYTVRMLLLFSCLLTVPISNLSAKTIFQDNFDSKKLSSEWKINRGDWKIEDGSLVNGRGGSIGFNVGKEKPWVFSCRIKVTQYEKKKYLDFNIFFTQENGNCYQLLLKPSTEWKHWGAGFYYIRQKEGGNLTATPGFSYFRDIEPSFNLNKWYRIKMVFTNDGLLYFYIDDKLAKKAPAGLSPSRISFSGSENGSLYLDEIKIEEYVAPERQSVFQDNFSNLSLWKLAGQSDGKEMTSIEGQYVRGTEDKGIHLHYCFTTSGQDAAYITREALIPSGNVLSLSIYGDNSKHRLFAVLKDKTGESHFISLPAITWKGERTIYQDFSSIKDPPPVPETRSAIHWGGDNNQVLDYPITSITIGINDKPDKFTGSGDIYFKSVEISL